MSGKLEALPGGRGRGKGRKRYTAEEKVAILRRHLVDRVPVSDLCDEVGLSPTAFYRWRKEFFENGAAAFQKERQASPPVERDIQTKPFYRAGFLCVVLAVSKLTTGVHWSWWRVLLPVWVVVGYSLLYIATGFIWESAPPRSVLSGNTTLAKAPGGISMKARQLEGSASAPKVESWIALHLSAA